MPIVVKGRKQRSSAPPGGPSGIYFGARIEGAFQASQYGASSSADAPGSSNLTNCPQDKFEAHVGKKVAFIHWGGAGNAWPPTDYSTGSANKVRARGAFSQYGMGFSTAGINDIIAMNSTAVTNLTTWFTQVKNHGHPILYRPIWEMNLASQFNWCTNNLSAANYKTLWQNLWGACADVMSGNGTAGSNTGTHTGNVSFFWCPNMYNPPSGVSDPALRFPGTAYVDWVGWDGYGQADGSYHTITSLYNNIYSICHTLAPGKPIAISEYGCEAGMASPGKAAWFDDLFDWLEDRADIKAFSYFNYQGNVTNVYIEEGDGNGNFSGNAMTKFASRISNSRYISNIVDSSTFTSGQKVPVPN